MFNGKVVLITGAASGIGAATATHFAKNGASLALTDRNMPHLEKVAKDCKQSTNQDPFLVKADLTIEADVIHLVESVVRHCNRLDVLINCAGIAEFDGSETSSLAQFDKIYNINVRAVYHLTMLAVPHLIQAKGCIVNVSSNATSLTCSDLLAYSMSKSAVDRFTKCLAKGLGPKGNRVNSVNAAGVNTPLWKSVGLEDKAVGEIFEREASLTPLGRIASADLLMKLLSQSLSLLVKMLVSRMESTC